MLPLLGKAGEATDSLILLSSQLQYRNLQLPRNHRKGYKIIRISPRAKRLAEDKHLNYNNLQGSGPNGRIITSDIEKLCQVHTTNTKTVPASGAEYTEQPLSNVRKLIAKAMHSSLQNSAQLTHHMSADVRLLLEARQKNKNEVVAGNVKQDITLNDMVCWCVIRALEKFPEANSHFLDDRIKTFQQGSPWNSC